MYRTIVEAVLAHGEEQPEKLAVAFKTQQVSYGELCRLMRGMALILSDRYQIGKGDFVALAAVSKPEYVAAWLAIQYLGAVSIPLDKSAKAAAVEDICDYAKPKLLLIDGRVFSRELPVASLKGLYAEGMEAAGMADPDTEAEINDELASTPYIIPEDDCLAEILFTTGTTGKPKGGMLSIGSVRAIVHNTRDGVGMREDDIVLLPLPLNHSVGMRVMRTTLYIGATLILQNGFTFAKELENNIAAYHCTGLVSVPASLEVVYRQMQDKFPEIIGQLRYLEIGAGSLSYDMKRKLLKMIPDTRVINTWGSTETGGAIFLHLSDHPDKLTSLGMPMDGIDFRTVDADGREVQATDVDTAGRMALRGPMQMMGYFEMPETTAQTLVDGWLLTNDLVYRDADGFVYMLGRADDIINVGGEKVSPIEVENVASEYANARDCACIGVDDPDGILGRVPVLFVVPESGTFAEDDMRRYLSDHLEKYKLPQHYVVVNEIPRNRMQKLDRKALARMWDESRDDEYMNETVRTILSRRSVREFTDEEIPQKILETILKCGAYAPSGHNMQTWQFTVLCESEKISALKELVERVAKEQRVDLYGFENPKVLILVSNDRRNHNGIQDSACAAENMMLAAQSYGIGSTWINVLRTLCDEPEIRETLDGYGIPQNHNVWAMVAMGYPKAPGKLLAKKDPVRWV